LPSAAFYSKLQPCLVGLKSCGGADFWVATLPALANTSMWSHRSPSSPTSRPTRRLARAEALCGAVL